jgi:hypothetical protein
MLDSPRSVHDSTPQLDVVQTLEKDHLSVASLTEAEGGQIESVSIMHFLFVCLHWQLQKTATIYFRQLILHCFLRQMYMQSIMRPRKLTDNHSHLTFLRACLINIVAVFIYRLHLLRPDE